MEKYESDVWQYGTAQNGEYVMHGTLTCGITLSQPHRLTFSTTRRGSLQWRLQPATSRPASCGHTVCAYS